MQDTTLLYRVHVYLSISTRLNNTARRRRYSLCSRQHLRVYPTTQLLYSSAVALYVILGCCLSGALACWQLNSEQKHVALLHLGVFSGSRNSYVI